MSNNEEEVVNSLEDSNDTPNLSPQQTHPSHAVINLDERLSRLSYENDLSRNPTVTIYNNPHLRPTVQQIRQGNIPHRKNAKKAIKVYPKQEGATHTVGTIVGVLSPCFVNIVNIIYFARLPFVVGTAGGFPTLLGFILSTILVTISIFSLSAMATNGEIESGGSYYILSRTIGPEIGGACGFCLAFGSLMGAAQANIGLLETIVILYQPFSCLGSKMLDVRIFSSILSVITGLLANYGFPLRMAIFILIWIGVIMYFIGLIFPQYTKSKDIISCTKQRLYENWAPVSGLDFSQFVYTFSIIFSGYGGILAGSNSSGNLKRPQISIPLGTLLALGLGILVYISTSLTLTLCHPRDQLISTWSNPIQDASFLQWFVFVASTAASIGKALTGLGAGPMVLTAMGNDGLIPAFFKKHSRLFGIVFAICFCMWGDFNSISSLSSSLFLCVLAFLNYGLFLAKRARALSFRPHFTFYNSEVALITCLLCIAGIILINYITAIIAFILAAIFYYITWKRHLDLPWGSLSHSNAYTRGLKAVLRLQHIPPHPKLYRPNIVLLIDGPPSEHRIAINFLNQMLKRKGLAIVARVFDSTIPLFDIVQERTQYFMKMASQKKVQIFYETVAASSINEALAKVMLLSGLGALRANVVFVEFDETLSDGTAHLIENILDRNWSIVMLRNPKRIDDVSGTIDCWCLFDDGGLELLLAYILASSKARKLRVLTFARVDIGEDPYQQKLILKHILQKYRIQAEVIIVPLSEAMMPSYYAQVLWNNLTEGTGIHDDETWHELTLSYMRISDAIRAYSSKSMIIVISLPKPMNSVPHHIYMRWLHLLSSVAPPVLYVRGNGTAALSWQV